LRHPPAIIAQAVAYHCNRLGIPVTIVMPQATPTIKVTSDRRAWRQGHPARRMFDDAYAQACELATEHGYVFVHPFDDPQVIAGQGTVGIECSKSSRPRTIVVPIGGGGSCPDLRLPRGRSSRA
jgi:threonine dehydratase